MSKTLKELKREALLKGVSFKKLLELEKVQALYQSYRKDPRKTEYLQRIKSMKK